MSVILIDSAIICVSERFSPLHHAALNGNVELITLLLESQAAVDIRDQKGKGGEVTPK